MRAEIRTTKSSSREPVSGLRLPGREGSGEVKRARHPIGQQTIIVGLVALLGLASQIQIVGYVVIALYTVAAVIWRVPSRVTFIAALIVLGCMAITTATGLNKTANVFGAYSFLLFAAAALCLCIELVRLSHRLRAD